VTLPVRPHRCLSGEIGWPPAWHSRGKRSEIRPFLEATFTTNLPVLLLVLADLAIFGVATFVWDPSPQKKENLLL